MSKMRSQFTSNAAKLGLGLLAVVGGVSLIALGGYAGFYMMSEVLYPALRVHEIDIVKEKYMLETLATLGGGALGGIIAKLAIVDQLPKSFDDLSAHIK